MGIDESQVSRLLAGEVPVDDPQLGKVSAYLSSLEVACPPSSVDAFEDRHLAVVAREVRLVGASRQRDRRGTASDRARTRYRRAFAATGAGLLVALTAGVGVASALGVNPLQIVPGLMKPWTSPDVPVVTPQPSDHPGRGPANGQQDENGSQPPVDPTAPPTVVGQPTAEPTSTVSPGKAHSPKPTKTNSGKSNSGNGNSGNGNSGKGKGNSGDPNPGKGKDVGGHKPTAAPTP
jgi:hypothetical protein